MDNRRPPTYQRVECDSKIDPRFLWQTRHQNPTQSSEPTEILAIAMVKDLSRLENREGIAYQLHCEKEGNFMVTLRIIDAAHYKQLAEEDNIIDMKLSSSLHPTAPESRNETGAKFHPNVK